MSFQNNAGDHRGYPKQIIGVRTAILVSTRGSSGDRVAPESVLPDLSGLCMV